MKTITRKTHNTRRSRLEDPGKVTVALALRLGRDGKAWHGSSGGDEV